MSLLLVLLLPFAGSLVAALLPGRENVAPGRIVDEPRGSGGFGYDAHVLDLESGGDEDPQHRLGDFRTDAVTGKEDQSGVHGLRWPRGRTNGARRCESFCQGRETASGA